MTTVNATHDIQEEKTEREIHSVFLVSILLKGFNAILEIVLGILLLFSHVVGDLIRQLAENALIDDPDGFLAAHMHSFVHLSPRAQFVGGLYLLGHGVVKCVLVASLLKRKAWAYPASIAVLGLFMFYEAIKFIETHSLVLAFLLLFDGSVVYLIWHEYKRARTRRTVEAV